MNSKQSNKKQILLSVLALLVILLVGAGITYSWIEGGTTYTILTENNGDVKTGANPYTGTGNEVFTKIILNPDSNPGTISLIDFDPNSKSVTSDTDSKDEQNLFFSPVLTSNGSDFFFPTSFNDNNEAVSFRKATTNDIGTKFINFKFDIEATKKCYLALNGEPEIGVSKGGVDISDTSAFRIMLKSGDERVILTTASSAQQTSVVTDEDGTAGTLTAQPFDNYLYNVDGTGKLFEYDKNDSDEMEVSVWLDGETASNDLIGSDVEVKMDLIVAEDKFKINFDAVTYTNTGSVSANGFTGGNIDGNSEAFYKYYTSESDVTATAVANTNYQFVGWYSDKACTQQVTTSTKLQVTAESETTYYAKFQEKNKYTITVSSYTLPSDIGGTVTVNGSGTTYTGYDGTTTTIKATANSGYSFVGWYTNPTCTGTAYSTSPSIIVTISANQTYYAKFLKQCKVTFISVTDDNFDDHSGGTVKIGSGTASTTVSTTVNYNTSLSLTASPNDGYEFEAISNGDGTEWVTTTISPTITSDVTYYAYFKTKPASTTTIYFETRTGFSTYSAYVYRKVDGVTTHYSGSWPGATATNDADTGYYKYAFNTTDIGTFNVIVSNNGSSQYPGSDSEGLVGTIGKTYLFKADNTLVEFDPSLKYTLTVLPSGTGGSATVNGASSATVYPNTSVTITATASSGYEFAGWYTNSACTTTIGSNYMTASQSVSVTATTTYYAKFTEVTANTLDIGVIYYLKENNTINQVYYWCSDGTNGTINLSSLTSTTRSYSVGSSYWSGAAQNFYCYSIEVPDNISGIKFKNSSNSWYGGDVTGFADGKIDLIFEYGGNYINYRTTY